MPIESFFAAGVLSSAIGSLAAAVLWLFFAVGLVRDVSGRAAFIAMTATFAWSLSLLSLYLFAPIPPRLVTVVVLLELTSLGLWFGVCLRILDIGPSILRNVRSEPTRALLVLATLAVIASTCGYALWAVFEVVDVRTFAMVDTGLHTARLLSAIMGLVLLEQVARNTRRDQQWNLKYLVIGLGAIFGYAFVAYSDAVLFGRMSPALMAAQGLVLVVAAPFLMIATLRNQRQRLHVNLSRALVFRSGALVLTGAYLFLIALGGFWLQTFGGSWAQVVGVLFVLAMIVGGVVLASSRTLRERMAVVLVRNLYDAKHDYRDQWLRITDLLQHSEADVELAERAIGAIGDPVHAHRGALWWRRQELLHPRAQLKTGWTDPLAPGASRALIELFEDDARPRRVADLPEGPARTALARLTQADLIVPLVSGGTLVGLVVLTTPETHERIDWEDEELLEVAARQIAAELQRSDNQESLGETRQLAAYNQMTAFVVHDLKTVVSQLSLMIRNADRHRDNPAFVDDMLRTSENTVQRIQSLLEHLRRPPEEHRSSERGLELSEILERTLDRQRALDPRPQLDAAGVGPDVRVRTQGDEIVDALAHLVQNAQEAAGPAGNVRITAQSDDDWAEIEVADDGPGMDEQFVRQRLFKPFESTKGVTGMGIGSWQAREYVRRSGGDIRVRSAPGAGARFMVRLPIAMDEPDDEEDATSAASDVSQGVAS